MIVANTNQRTGFTINLFSGMKENGVELIWNITISSSLYYYNGIWESSGNYKLTPAFFCIVLFIVTNDLQGLM